MPAGGPGSVLAAAPGPRGCPPWRQQNPEKHREITRHMGARYRIRLRAAVLNHYGQKCACCGATGDLTIDHIPGTAGSTGP